MGGAQGACSPMEVLFISLIDTVYHPLTGVLAGASVALQTLEIRSIPPELTCTGQPAWQGQQGGPARDRGSGMIHITRSPHPSHSVIKVTELLPLPSPRPAGLHVCVGKCGEWGAVLHRNHTSVPSWKAEEGLLKNANRIIKYSVSPSLYLKYAPK